MTEKRPPRSPLVISDRLVTDVSIRAYEKGMLKVLDRVAPFIEFLCECYVEGRFDEYVEKVNDYSRARTTRSSHINPDLKNKVGIHAYHKKRIKSPRYAVRVIEMLMKKYLYGDLDKAINKKLNK
jgi:hypothetical protein